MPATRTKLTLRVDEQAIARAKAIAAARGTSVSRLVERYFESLEPASGAPDTGELTPWTSSLVGAFGRREVDEEEYHAHLEERYL